MACRDLPTLKDYVAKTGSLPKCLATSLATLIAFYTQELVAREGDGLHLRRADGTEYTAQDDAFVLDFYAAHAGTDDAELVHDVLTNEQMWGENLTQIAGLEEFVVGALAVVRTGVPSRPSPTLRHDFRLGRGTACPRLDFCSTC